MKTRISYEQVDTLTGEWRWAVVKNYRGPQDFDDLLVVLEDEEGGMVEERIATAVVEALKQLV